MNYQVISRKNLIIPHIKESTKNSVYRFPSVSIFMPFEPKLGMKNKLVASLESVVERTANELQDRYPGEMSSIVLHKLREIIKNLNYNSFKKSIAIFVSPVFEKIYYLNIELEERIIVAGSFNIGNIIYSKKKSQKFHILLLSEKESRIFLSDANSSIRIIPGNTLTKNSIQDFSESSTNHGIDMEQYLQHIDHSLGIIIQSNKLPVFVMGSEKMIESFKNITRHNGAITESISGSFGESSLEILKKLLEPYLAEWQQIKQKNLLYQLADAANRNKLALGKEKVWQDVMSRRGQLLLLGKKYLYNADLWADTRLKNKKDSPYNRYSCIQNPIDEMIERVLESGGDVAFVSDGILKGYDPIALIKHI